MADLVAKVTLTGDASGLVGAAGDGSAALDKLSASAAAAGDAAGSTIVPFNASSAAIAGQAQASQMAAAALTAGGQAKIDEIARLAQLASASSATASSITALSAAHAGYNATVNQARTLLAAGAIGQAEYESAIQGATAKLAVAKIAHEEMSSATVNEMQVAAALGIGLQSLGGDTEQAAVAAEHGARATEKFAIGAGHLGERAGLLRIPLRAVKEIIEGMVAEPQIAIFAALAAAIGTGVYAVSSYDNAILKLEGTMAESGNLAGGTAAQYEKLAAQMATMADVSQHTGMAMADTLVKANVPTQAWMDLTAAATNMAHATGVEVPDALEKLAQMMDDPVKSAHQLAAETGMLTQAQIALIAKMEEEGDHAGAVKQLADDIRDHFKGAADATSFWARAWDGLKDSISGALTAFAQWEQALAHPTPGPNIRARNLQAANGNSSADWWSWMDSGPTNIRARNLQEAQAGNQPDTQTPPPPTAAQTAAAAEQAERNKLDEQGAQIEQAEAYGGKGDEIAAIDKKIAALKSLNETEGETAARESALNELEKQRADVIKHATEAHEKLTGAAKDAEEEDNRQLSNIRSLIAEGPKAIAQSQLHAQQLEREAQATDGTSESIKKLQDSYKISEAVQPYIEALKQAADLHARGKMTAAAYAIAVKELKSAMAAMALATREAIAAQDELNAKQDVAAKFGELKSSGTAAQVYAADLERALEWKNQSLDAVAKVEAGYSAYAAKVMSVYEGMVKKARDDDLKNATDWSSGVQRELNDLTKSEQNWAETSADLLKGFADQSEDAFVKMATGGKNVLQNFFQWIEEQMLKLAYQQLAAPMMNNLWAGIIGEIGDALGMPGGGSAGGFGGGLSGVLSAAFGGETNPYLSMDPVTVTPGIGSVESASGGGLSGFLSGLFHTGGVVGRPAPMYVSVSPAAFETAVRYHAGTREIPHGIPIPGLAHDEVPIIAQAGESVLTRQQTKMADAMGIFRTFHDGGVVGDIYASTTGMPVMMQPPASSSAPPVNINVQNNHPGAQVSAGQPQQKSDGSWSLDVMVEQVDRMLAYRNQIGKSYLTQSLENTHGVRRGVP